MTTINITAWPDSCTSREGIARALRNSKNPITQQIQSELDVYNKTLVELLGEDAAITLDMIVEVSESWYHTDILMASKRAIQAFAKKFMETVGIVITSKKVTKVVTTDSVSPEIPGVKVKNDNIHDTLEIEPEEEEKDYRALFDQAIVLFYLSLTNEKQEHVTEDSDTGDTGNGWDDKGPSWVDWEGGVEDDDGMSGKLEGVIKEYKDLTERDSISTEDLELFLIAFDELWDDEQQRFLSLVGYESKGNLEACLQEKIVQKDDSKDAGVETPSEAWLGGQRTKDPLSRSSNSFDISTFKIINPKDIEDLIANAMKMRGWVTQKIKKIAIKLKSCDANILRTYLLGTLWYFELLRWKNLDMVRVNTCLWKTVKIKVDNNKLSRFLSGDEHIPTTRELEVCIGVIIKKLGI